MKLGDALMDPPEIQYENVFCQTHVLFNGRGITISNGNSLLKKEFLYF